MTLFLKSFAFKVTETTFKSHVRCYARWQHRTPKRVLTAEEYEKQQATFNSNEQNLAKAALESEEVYFDNKIKWRHPQQPVSGINNKSDTLSYKITTKSAFDSKPKKVPGKKSTTDMLETVIDADGNFVYQKLKDNDPVVSTLLTTVKSRQQQIKKDFALLEGKRLIKEALENHCALKCLLFSRKDDVEYLKPFLPKLGAKIYKIPYKELQMWSDLSTSPGIMGIFKTPEVENFTPTKYIPLTILCDNVREPGNLGAILRIASGAEAKNIILTKGCVDLWDTKVLRAAAGAHFRLRICKKVEWTQIRDLLDPGTTVLIADNHTVTENFKYTSAGSKVMQQDNSEMELKENGLEQLIQSISVVPYYAVDFKNCTSILLIIGGETEGISENSFRLASEFNGLRLNIPLGNGIESLNTGTALGIISFEIKRQLLLKSKS